MPRVWEKDTDECPRFPPQRVVRDLDSLAVTIRNIADSRTLPHRTLTKTTMPLELIAATEKKALGFSARKIPINHTTESDGGTAFLEEAVLVAPEICGQPI